MKLQLKTRQICLFIIAFFPITKIFVLPSILAENANEDMWLSAIFSLLLDFVCLISIIFACKKAKTDFFSLLKSNLGKVGEIIVLSVYFFYFMLKAVLPLAEQRDYVELTLYTLVPTVLYFLPFFIAAFFLCTKKIRVLGRAADVMWFSTILGFIILISMSISNADFEAILPIGASGTKAILSGTYNSLNWFGDAAYILFFIGEFKTENHSGRKLVISYLISAIMIISFMIIFYSIFTSIAYRQRFALTEISKYTTVINNMGRFDYFGIMFILLSSVFALSLPMYFSCRILNRIFNFSKVYIAPIIVIGIQVLIMLLFNEKLVGIINFIKRYGGFYFLIVGNILPIFSVLLKNKKEQENANT